MEDDLIRRYGLERWREELRAGALPCLRGYPSEEPSLSYAGGLPTVGEGFVWPEKDGVPLEFVGQIDCAEVPDWDHPSGCLLFFYTNRHWGYSPKDAGHAVVLWQEGERTVAPSEVPEQTHSHLFGLLRSTVAPKVYRKVHLALRSSTSYPSWERAPFTFPNDQIAEAYAEFLAELESPVQIGGHPAPVQSDDMEGDCAFCTGIPRECWKLLVQFGELGDQQWGDAGALFWFIAREDLLRKDFSRVWMVSQCH